MDNCNSTLLTTADSNIPSSLANFLIIQARNTGNELSPAQFNTPPLSPDEIGDDDDDPTTYKRCETCNINFISHRQKCEHLRDVHGVEKPFKCEHCQARFPYSSSLYNHSRIHSESRPFKCNVCNSAFRWKNSLRHHRLYIHKEEPSSVKIAAKSVLEGKKPPPADEALDVPIDAKKSRTDSPLQMIPIQAIKGGVPVEIFVANLLPKPVVFSTVAATSSDSISVQQEPIYASAISTIDSTSNGGESKRKRKPASTFRRQVDQVDQGPLSNKASSSGHTCGHCERICPDWNDLVSHIKECAEKNRDSLDEGSLDWIGSVVKEEVRDSDADSDTAFGLVIDQDGFRADADTFGEDTEISDSANAISQIVSMDSSDFPPSRDQLQQRVLELEQQLDDVTQKYEARIASLESTVIKLKSQLVKKS